MTPETAHKIGLDVRLTYYTHGGIAKYIRRLAESVPGLDPANAYTHFYRRGHAETFSPAARRVDCWTPAHHRLEPIALSVEVSRAGVDLLHSPDFIPPLWGYKRSVITVHDLTFLLHPEFLTPESRRYYNDQIGRAVRLADAISADSQATADDLVRLLHVPANKITVIHLGVDEVYQVMPPEAVAAARARLGLPQEYILYVGTFEPRKNIPGLLGAYVRLRQQAPDAPPLVLVGNRGWLFEPIAELMQDMGLGEHVRFVENLPPADLPAVYNGANLFVLLSHYEGFGLPVLEAMACGVPAVIADRASLPEIAGGAAMAVDPDDREAAAAAMFRALDDAALRASLRAQGLAQAATFTWARTAQRTVELYGRVLSD